MKNFFYLLIFVSSILNGQLPYTTAGEFNVRIEKNIEYGKSINYMGYEDTLLLDLYKPIGDENENRPVLFLIHGGTWIGGCKDEPYSGIVPLANEFASRGYMVASINYRMGWHKDDYVLNPTSYPWPETYKSLYAADSNEMIRAIFRGMQDAKGAIRFLKARNMIDSTCVQNFYVGGESAGAFIALASAFLDTNEEKPDACFAIENAVDPQDNLPNAVADCDYHIYPFEETSLIRNDLGSIDGDLNINGFDAKVKGVCSFYGGVPSEGFSKHWFDNNTDIATYFYHQTCDGIVDFNYGKPMEIISANCNLGYSPWHENYPHMFGNGSISEYLNLTGDFNLLTDYISCDPFIFALFDCIRFADNGSYHYTGNVAERAINVAEFFSPIILENESDANCKMLPDPIAQIPISTFNVFPNPFKENLFISSTEINLLEATIWVTDLSGNKLITTLFFQDNLIKLHAQFPAGVYFLNIESTTKKLVYKIILL